MQNAGLIFSPNIRKTYFLSHISAFILKFKLMRENAQYKIWYGKNLEIPRHAKILDCKNKDRS